MKCALLKTPLTLDYCFPERNIILIYEIRTVALVATYFWFIRLKSEHDKKINTQEKVMYKKKYHTRKRNIEDKILTRKIKCNRSNEQEA